MKYCVKSSHEGFYDRISLEFKEVFYDFGKFEVRAQGGLSACFYDLIIILSDLQTTIRAKEFCYGKWIIFENLTKLDLKRKKYFFKERNLN